MRVFKTAWDVSRYELRLIHKVGAIPGIAHIKITPPVNSNMRTLT